MEYSNKPLPGAKPRWSPSHIKGLIGEPSLLLPVGRGSLQPSCLFEGPGGEGYHVLPAISGPQAEYLSACCVCQLAPMSQQSSLAVHSRTNTGPAHDQCWCAGVSGVYNCAGLANYFNEVEPCCTCLVPVHCDLHNAYQHA